jgi:HK97 family phage major capsid protein
MSFNNTITRSDAAAMMPEQVSKDIVAAVPQASAVLSLARRLPNMSRNQMRMPVLAQMADGYFVAETGMKQTTKVSWENKYIYAEEIAVIVPISESILDDIDYPIWDEVMPQIVSAFGSVFDAAVLYGTNIPATWNTAMGGAGLIAVATAASQVKSLAAYTDLYEAILGEKAAGPKGIFGLVEEDGFSVTGSIAPLATKGKLRNVRDTTSQPIFKKSMQDPTGYDLDGTPIIFPTNGSISTTYHLISGQWDQLVYSMRQDMTFKILTEATIQDAAGNILFNLAQQDMVALRAVMRLGVALPNPINAVQKTAANRCAFAALTA